MKLDIQNHTNFLKSDFTALQKRIVNKFRQFSALVHHTESLDLI